VRVHQVEVDVDGVSTPIPELVGVAKPDLVLLNDDDLAYAKIRLDDDSLTVAIEHLADIENPLARAVVWGAAWDATRDGEMRASDYVQLVLGNIATETESTTIRLSLTQLIQAARVYVSPAVREETIERVGTQLWALARTAEPGSDLQFQLVKFFANVASTPAHGQTLQGLLNGSVAIEGLTVDTDLSWELLEGVVLTGLAGSAEIDAMLASDNTSNGQQAAARARATIPTPEGKRAALETLIAQDDLPNVIVRMMGMGFQHVNDPSSLEDVVQTYLGALTEIWANRSFTIAEYFAIWFYPSPLATKELVDATKEWLAANTENAALRRLVIEGLAGVERALMVQERDHA
jgi:aminopeptidase N